MFAGDVGRHPLSLSPHTPAGVGKTCLLLRFVDDKFSPSFITTIGIDFKVKQVKIGDKKVKLQVRVSVLRRVRRSIDVKHAGVPADLGHSGPGTLPEHHNIVLSRCAGGSRVNLQ